ncbi:MAG: glycerol-3-phosphate 1-O-acyltransferase PlsY [candidate division Zixibacteria bacterium]|nr:glycerol-3-phosphate 1-O-acyltransferase PlsY [candidate division Zixibacteria bacterium]
MLDFAAAVVLSYLVGAIPTSIIAGKLLKGIDIREHGSGNAGATNVYRVLGAVPAVVVLLLDAGKGVLAVFVFAPLASERLIGDPVAVELICGLVAILGHSFPVWASFKGGKGVGTGAGVMFSIIPIVTAILVAIFILVVAITRYVSLGSVVASVLLPIAVLFEKFILGMKVSNILIWICIFLALFVVLSHRANIKRLIAGTEHKFGEKTKSG